MADERMKAVLDRLVPPSPAERGWDDVLMRAGRIRRRRRRRTVLLAVVTAGALIVASLAAAGQISLLSHSKEPHLLLRGELRRPDGTHAGTIEIELHRAMVGFGRSVAVRPFGPARLTARASTAASYPARWFLELDGREDDLARGSLSIRRSAPHAQKTVVTLCAPCRTHDSGRVELSSAQASALVNDRVAFVVVTRSAQRAAAGPVDLDRSRLRQGLICRTNGATGLWCSRIYTGR
jgi:hypothetical protein